MNAIVIELTVLSGVKVISTALTTIVTLVMLICGILISHILIRRVTSPLYNLKRVMVASSESDDMAMVEEVKDKELNQLIKAYNVLAVKTNKQNEKIMDLAYRDELTGLANRVKFDTGMKETLKDCGPLAFICIDIDNFKYVNDAYGHLTGDRLLVLLAERVRNYFRDGVVVARISGDEFGIGLKEYGTIEELKKTVEGLMEIIREPYELNLVEFQVVASVGVARYPEDGTSFSTLMAHGDMAMHRAKDLGKNCYTLYNEDIHRTFMNEVSVKTKLKKAITKKEIYPVFQPLVDVKQSGRIKGFEALARWEDPDIGPIYPDVFIPIAEKNQSIIALGAHILERALAFSRELYEAHGEYFEMSVNVSVIQLKYDGFIEMVEDQLRHFGIPAQYLNLEITESVALESSEILMKKLSYLRGNGVRISLDDFGTGYSSLGYLTDLSLSHIKIDRALVLKAKESDEVFQLMKGIVRFAHTMGYKVVAEGIEDKAMEKMVIDMNADYGQGYMYARPMSEEDIHILLSI